MRSALSLLKRPEIDRRALQGYRRERVTELTVPIALALMEGGFVGVVADKVYHVHPFVLAVISAAPMFSNLSSFLWARLARGRPKVPFVTALEGAMVALIALVALAPEGQLGAGYLVTATIMTRLLLAGSITVRSTIWSLNYPDAVRARLTGRLQLLTTITMALSSLTASVILDRNPESFRLLYLATASVAVVGVIAFSRVPHIGGERLLALERGELEHEGESRPTRGIWAVLRNDADFARYQACQFLLGVSNMMLEGPLIYLVSRQLGASYLQAICITMVIPFLLTTVTLPLWAHYIDRVHIARFRVTQSGLWILSQALVWLGAVQGSLAIIAAGRVVLGLARGGGGLAWTVGHNDFAGARDLSAYMGAHVTLTGVRGSFAPFLGMLLYVGFALDSVPLLSASLPAWSGLGPHTFGVSCALSTLSALGFTLLARRIRV